MIEIINIDAYVRLRKGQSDQDRAPQGQSPLQGLKVGEKCCENTKKPATSDSYLDTINKF